MKPPPVLGLIGAAVLLAAAAGCGGDDGTQETAGVPVANAGADQEVAVGTPVSLDGSRSRSPSGAALNYVWALSVVPSGSAASLSAAESVNPTFTPDVEGVYEIELEVDDGANAGKPDTVAVTASRFAEVLPYAAVDAEYSTLLDRIVLVSANPNQLHIHDPATGKESAVALPQVPACVSVHPAAPFAAVCHDANVSYVNLSTATVERILPVSVNVYDAVLAANGWIYAVPTEGGWDAFRCIKVDTGEETVGADNDLLENTVIRLHPNGRWIYGANKSHPNDLDKFSIEGGTATALYDSQYHGDYDMCENAWIYETGARIITACGNVFSSTELQETDMVYAGKIENSTSVVAAVHSSTAGAIVTVPGGERIWDDIENEDTVMNVYDPDFLTFRKQIALPRMKEGDSKSVSHGRFVFFDSTGTKLFVVVNGDADAPLAARSGVAVIDGL
ncbi:MAG: hypothetical protein HY897_14250 [Deltaproteobacteria bacterium]|nr:hypothetical protein [Deltaproteobacteria bacterium]